VGSAGAVGVPLGAGSGSDEEPVVASGGAGVRALAVGPSWGAPVTSPPPELAPT
jgi:hypothetical protein